MRLMVTDRIMDATEVREEELSQDSVCRVEFLEKQHHLLKARSNKIVHKQKPHVRPASGYLGRTEALFLLHLSLNQ